MLDEEEHVDVEVVEEGLIAGGALFIDEILIFWDELSANTAFSFFDWVLFGLLSFGGCLVVVFSFSTVHFKFVYLIIGIRFYSYKNI